MGTQPGRLRKPPSWKQDLLQEGAGIAVDLHQRTGQGIRIPGEAHRVEIGVVLPRARQPELCQGAECGRRHQQEDGQPVDVDVGEQQQRQVDEEQQLTEQGEHTGEPGEEVRHAHHPGIVGTDVAHLVGQHRRQFPLVEHLEQAIGDGDHRVILPSGGKGVDEIAGNVVELRRTWQARPTGEGLHHGHQPGRLFPGEALGAVHAHQQPRAQGGIEQQQHGNADQYRDQAIRPPQQPAHQRCESCHQCQQQQQQRLEAVGQRVLLPEGRVHQQPGSKRRSRARRASISSRSSSARAAPERLTPRSRCRLRTVRAR